MSIKHKAIISINYTKHTHTNTCEREREREREKEAPFSVRHVTSVSVVRFGTFSYTMQTYEAKPRTTYINELRTKSNNT